MNVADRASDLVQRACGLKKMAVVLGDGVGIRNFVLSPFLRECSAEVLLLHRCPEDLIPLLSPQKQSIQWSQMPDTQDSATTFTLRQALSYAHVYWADTHSMRYTRSRPVQGSWRTRAATRTARAVGRVSAWQPAIRLLEEAYFRSVERTEAVAHYRKMFREDKPEILLSGNHKLPGVAAPVLAARSLGIPTATFVASWDNLTSKGRIAAPFDYFLVWSDLMKKELLQLYPHLGPEQVHIVGTPQFDSYGNPDLLVGREKFFRRVNADPERPLICYSGGDEGTCPEDQGHLRLLLQLVREKEIRGNPQVLLRPCPVDPGFRYNQVLSDFPELLYAAPAWCHPRAGEWSACVPLPDDVDFLANLTVYADLNVNIASTMTLDFGIHDKPVVNIAYDLTSPPPLRVPLQELFYTWEHYRPVVDLKAARLAHSPEELAAHVNAYLDNPSADRQGRKDLFKLQVGVPLGKSSNQILNVLSQLVQ